MFDKNAHLIFGKLGVPEFREILPALFQKFFLCPFFDPYGQTCNYLLKSRKSIKITKKRA